jgi:hypothetical protein
MNSPGFYKQEIESLCRAVPICSSDFWMACHLPSFINREEDLKNASIYEILGHPGLIREIPGKALYPC